MERHHRLDARVDEAAHARQARHLGPLVEARHPDEALPRAEGEHDVGQRRGEGHHPANLSLRRGPEHPERTGVRTGAEQRQGEERGDHGAGDTTRALTKSGQIGCGTPAST